MCVSSTVPAGAVAILAAAMIGCANTTADVKIASTQMSAALAELRAGAASFSAAYVAEVDRTRLEIRKAIAARAVRNRIDVLAQDFDSPEWQRRFTNRGLIALSEEIEAAQEEARMLADYVWAFQLGPEETAADGLIRVRNEYAESLRHSAELLRQAGDTAAARSVEERAAEFKGFSEDAMISAYLESLLGLGAMRSEIPRNMREFQQLVEMLQATHAVVHDWVMTDVKVSGQQVGELLVKNAELFGLDSVAEEGGGQ